jgi:adenosylcobinamide-phosphate synthase
MALDAILGEPKWLWNRIPHPAVLMGRAVAWMDARFNKGAHRRRKGILCCLALCLGGLVIGLVLQRLPGGWILQLLVVAVLLAQRSLADHVRAVAQALRESPLAGRAAVAMIVGRDTAQMDGAAIARAAIESAAENMSDGVIAPIFWYLVAGLPGILIYKIVNTADSMIGYLTPKHAAFGWASARLDDLLNLIPARLTAVMIAGLHRQLGAWPEIVADARRHRSPNAGWPEAAMSRALGVAVSGPRSYEGEMRDFPFVNAGGRREIGAAEIEASIAVLWRLWALVFGLVLFLAVGIFAVHL